MMQELGPEPNSSEIDLADYRSCYLTWYDGEYGEPLVSSQGAYDDFNFEETGDYSSRSMHADDRETGNAEIGSGNWFGEYESYFGDHWGGHYQEDSSYQQQMDGISSSNNDDMELDYSENQWFGDYGDLGFEDYEEDFHQGGSEFEYGSSWDEWEETILYEQIFGD